MRKLITRFKLVTIYGLGQSLNSFGLLIVSLVVIKFKSIEFWGTYVELHIWINLLLLFASFGNKDQLLKRFSLSPSSIYQDWLTNFTSRLVLLIPCFVFLIVIPPLNPLIFYLIPWLVLSFIGQSFNSLILFNRDFKISAQIEVITNICYIILVIILNRSLNINGLLKTILIINLIRNVLYLFYYSNHLKSLNIRFRYNELMEGLPFFIPLALGTARTKMDTYFATTLFQSEELGKYQILVNFLSIGQLLITYFFNPFIKSFYRLKQIALKRLKFQSLIFGFGFGLLYLLVIHIGVSKIFLLQFSQYNYIICMAFLFPLGLQMLIVNQIYKIDKQYIIISVSIFVIILQITIGYSLMKNNGISGALWVKSASLWIITVLLWIWSRKFIKK